MDEELQMKLRRVRFLHYIKIVPDTGCHEWTTTRYKIGGYGQFYWGEVDGKCKTMKAHRAAWLLFRGPISDGGHVLHKCNNAACNNPEHLYIGTHIDNMRDRDVSGRTSKWDRRYNFKRNPDLIAKIKELLPSGRGLEDIRQELGIGWQTIYRARAQDKELDQMIKDTKHLRYSAGARKRYL